MRVRHVLAVYVDPWGGFQASVPWNNADYYIVEQVLVPYMKSTRPRACRNFSYFTFDPLSERAQFVHRYGPLRPNIEGDSHVTCSQQRNPQTSR